MLKTYNQCKSYRDRGSFYNSSGPLILEYETEFVRGKNFRLSWRQVQNAGSDSYVSGILEASSSGSTVTMRKHRASVGDASISAAEDAIDLESAPSDVIEQEKSRNYVSVFDAIQDVEGVIQSLVIVPQYLFYPPDEIVATGVFDDLGEAEELIFNDEECVKLASMVGGIRRELVLARRNGTIRRHFMGTGEALEQSQCEASTPTKPMTNCLDIRYVEMDAGIFS